MSLSAVMELKVTGLQCHVSKYDICLSAVVENKVPGLQCHVMT